MTGVIFASVICFLRLQEGVSIHKIIEIWVKIGLISVKFKVYTNFSITKWLFIDIFFVLLQRTIIAMFIAIEVRRVLSWWHTRQPTPCWVWRSHNDKAVQSGHWVGKCSPDILKAFTWRCVWDESNLANSNPVLNVATVDVPGVIISLLRRPVCMDCTFLGTMIVYYGLLMEMIIHKRKS